MRREERVTVQGPVKEQQPDGMSHRGGGRAGAVRFVLPLLPGRRVLCAVTTGCLRKAVRLELMAFFGPLR